jgi:hypothetical protein
MPEIKCELCHQEVGDQGSKLCPLCCGLTAALKLLKAAPREFDDILDDLGLINKNSLEKSLHYGVDCIIKWYDAVERGFK